MNKFSGYLTVGALAILLVLAFTTKENENPVKVVKGEDFNLEIPEDVNAVLQNYCFGCHNTESKNEKGKDKLTIDNLGEMPKGKLAAKLNKIAKEVDEGDMPPEKFLAKYPDKEPSKKDKKKVINWAKSAAKSL